MNQKAIKKHFEKSWKKNRHIIIARTNGGRLWVSDNIVLIAVNEDDPVLDGSEIFLNTPLAPGTSRWTSKSDISNMGETPNVQALIYQSLKRDSKQLTVTDWYKAKGSSYFRLLTTKETIEDEQEIFIDVDLLNLVVDPKEEISDYQFLGTKRDHPVLVKNKENELVALLMPVLP